MKRTILIPVVLSITCLILNPAYAQQDASSAASGAQSPLVASSSLSKAELALWNDPEFKKSFVQSYIADSEIEPRVTEGEREKMLKILELISSDRMSEAAVMLEKSRGEAVSAVFDFTLANIYFQEEKLDEAAVVYQVAVEKYPKFRRAWRNLGLIHVRRGRFEEALAALTRVVELGGADAVTYGLLGYAYSSVENNLPAESAYRMAILLDPETMDWQMGLARSLFKQERYAEAISLCRSLLADNPGRSDLWLLQANAYIGLNQPLKAAENYELIDRLGGATLDSLNMLGDIYTNEGLFEMAVNTYIRAMEKYPDESKPQRALRAAQLMTARGALADTRRLIERIDTLYGARLETDERKDLLKLRARLAVSEGAGDEEVKVLEQIVEIDPLDGEALILLGQHAGRNGDDDKAVFYYERAAAIEKHEADAKIRHAQLLVRQGKYDQALPLLRSAQLLKPRDDVRKYLEHLERVAKGR
ncbi:MAG: tetratricopeptide repeat protein [Candidatus Omnitrophica bacterium]|nr:tetratricopeptide repeat protein [Candidatus Omnitrophota bacterium]